MVGDGELERRQRDRGTKAETCRFGPRGAGAEEPAGWAGCLTEVGRLFLVLLDMQRREVDWSLVDRFDGRRWDGGFPARGRRAIRRSPVRCPFPPP